MWKNIWKGCIHVVLQDNYMAHGFQSLHSKFKAFFQVLSGENKSECRLGDYYIIKTYCIGIHGLECI